MGSQLINIYRNKIKKEWKIAFAATFVIGMLVHIYRFTNDLPNHDALFNFYSSQNMVGSGRWFLSIACGFSSYFNLPWVIGLFSVIFIAVTAVIVSDTFDMKNPVLIILSGGLLASFPAITETFFFEFTADGYMIAMILAALSVWLTRIGRSGKVYRTIIAAACICLSCGIYQAYLSFALVLALGYFIYEILEDRYDNKTYRNWILQQIIVYAAGLIAYLIIWKICMVVEGYEATTYMGISSLGESGVSSILEAAYSAVFGFVLYFLRWNIFRYGITVYIALNILFLLFAAFVIITAIIKSRIYKKIGHLILLLLSGIAIPFAVFIWKFASGSSVSYGVRMQQSICLCFILIAVLCERWIKPKLSSVMALLLALIVVNNGITANKFYYFMNSTYEKTYATVVEMQTRIHLLDDGTIKYIAFVGGAMLGLMMMSSITKDPVQEPWERLAV